MRYGRLSRLVTIQRKVVTYSASGQPVEAWSDLASRLSASVDQPKGSEGYSAPEVVAKQQVEFQLRWRPELADLSPLDRILYPPPSDRSPPPAIPRGSIYDIVDVSEIGRRRGLKVIAVRRADL